ncbi:MAG: D-inositol-3-phosphate glycosyltransferase [Flavobacteriales bacterium]|nr:D-inositol-3-phosphate glycosyltransferase [Flavobacteriales bacterium]
MSKIKITYILSNIDKAIAFEWVADKLNHDRFELSFILLNNKEPFLFNWLKEKKIECYYIPHFGKKCYPITFIKTLFFLLKIKPKIVHTHLLDANLIGLLAAKVLGIKKRIYTRHHSTFHHEYFPKAIKWDKYTNFLATDIVAISENVKQVLLHKENVNHTKIHLIHHGFDLEKFSNILPLEVEDLKQKYKLQNNAPIIGVISRFINWKGIQFIVSAFKQILKNYPNAKLVLANSTGPDKSEIDNILQQELTPHQYKNIAFEPNLFALYQMFDVYVHVPINKEIEAFGQTYVEALAAGIPSVFTLSGVASEFIEHYKNALVVDYENSNQIYNAIIELLTDKTFAKKLIENGKNSIKPFNLNLFIQKLENLYE